MPNAHFVFQHLPDPLKAAQAISRLLKPGGKLIIIDSDDAIFGMVHPAVPELPTLLEIYGQAQSRRGGNRQIGRQLWRLLAQAGLVPKALEAIAFHSDELGMGAFREHLDPERFVPLVRANLLSEEAFAQARASFERFLASPEHFVMMLWLAAYGEKPSS
jgi:SAM-dependent methyltransferase